MRRYQLGIDELILVAAQDEHHQARRQGGRHHGANGEALDQTSKPRCAYADRRQGALDPPPQARRSPVTHFRPGQHAPHLTAVPQVGGTLPTERQMRFELVLVPSIDLTIEECM